MGLATSYIEHRTTQLRDNWRIEKNTTTNIHLPQRTAKKVCCPTAVHGHHPAPYIPLPRMLAQQTKKQLRGRQLSKTMAQSMTNNKETSHPPPQDAGIHKPMDSTRTQIEQIDTHTYISWHQPTLDIHFPQCTKAQAHYQHKMDTRRNHTTSKILKF